MGLVLRVQNSFIDNYNLGRLSAIELNIFMYLLQRMTYKELGKEYNISFDSIKKYSQYKGHHSIVEILENVRKKTADIFNVFDIEGTYIVTQLKEESIKKFFVISIHTHFTVIEVESLVRFKSVYSKLMYIKLCEHSSTGMLYITVDQLKQLFDVNMKTKYLNSDVMKKILSEFKENGLHVDIQVDKNIHSRSHEISRYRCYYQKKIRRGHIMTQVDYQLGRKQLTPTYSTDINITLSDIVKDFSNVNSPNYTHIPMSEIVEAYNTRFKANEYYQEYPTSAVPFIHFWLVQEGYHRFSMYEIREIEILSEDDFVDIMSWIHIIKEMDEHRFDGYSTNYIDWILDIEQDLPRQLTGYEINKIAESYPCYEEMKETIDYIIEWDDLEDIPDYDEAVRLCNKRSLERKKTKNLSVEEKREKAIIKQASDTTNEYILDDGDNYEAAEPWKDDSNSDLFLSLCKKYGYK